MSLLSWWGFEANVDLPGFRRKRQRNFEEMQLINGSINSM